MYHPFHDDGYPRRAEGQQEAWSTDELERAMRESMDLPPQTQPGVALLREEMKQMNLYYESQPPGSDTCGLNALNNLCQRCRFSVDDLTRAEADHAQAQDGGSFAQVPNLHEVPSGFFDVEALKIAAGWADLEFVDVEPVPDFEKSRCFAFAEAARSSADGGWFLGFLVYDRQPGQMHYYALRRDERTPGAWLKLDSLPAAGAEPRNRQLTDEDLWSLYESNKPLFQAWLLRWYPVVYRPSAAREVCRALEGEGYSLSKERAMRVSAESGWLVPSAVRRLLHVLPQAALRELLVQFARPSEAEMRCLLEASGWDLSAAQPAIDRVLKQRVALAKEVDVQRPRLALSLCDWEPRSAASLLALQLQLGADNELLPELQQALSLAGGDGDRAEAVVKLQPSVVSMQVAASILEQTGTWSVEAAKRVLEVKRRFPGVSVPVAMEVLRCNDDDPHAAGEMLAEYQQRIQRIVTDQGDGSDIFSGEAASIAETALSATDWDPRKAFLAARNLAHAVQSTRRLVRHRGCNENFAVDAVLAGLTAGDMKPKLAAALLLGEALPPVAQALQAPLKDRGPPKVTAKPAAAEPSEDEYCSVM